MNNAQTQSTKSNVTALKDGNILALYLQEINQIPLLSREEEVALAKRVREGDIEAREKLATSNLRFVVNVAKQYRNQGLSFLDLINEGNLGLLNAVERFDVDRGYRFISYAVWWIQQSIRKAICEKSRLIRLPLNRANELVQIHKAKRFIDESMSGEEEVAHIAKMLGLVESLVAELTSISRDPVSLDTPVYEDKDTTSLSDMLEDTAYQLPESAAMDATLKYDLEKALEILNEREAEIIRYRFGLDGEAPMSLKEIGDRYNLTKERIRQIEKKALERLRASEEMQRLKDYVSISA